MVEVQSLGTMLDAKIPLQLHFDSNPMLLGIKGLEKESIHRPAPVQNFSLPKKWGPQRKDFGGGYGFPGFYRHIFVSTTGLERFFFEARKVLQKIFFQEACENWRTPCSGV